ncbi:MAG: bifunctional folylpolyglutamate synthase/dihydrofolate synthase [Tissierellia bacterium]|nr:bifunctional folylpolyglutamate synthase/dihydrofolate synthase [Tissierellia bacterium]
MNYQETLAYINSPEKMGSRFGLESIGRLLKKMGNPQDKLRFIHVAGTNGKGSTCAFMEKILFEEGYNVGLFTSPYIRSFNDRIQVGGEDITNDDVAEIGSWIRILSEEIEEEGYLPPTTFEMVTAMGFYFFYLRKADPVILEVGLGGALDCTNIIKSPMAAVLTPIGYDHCQVLGNTLKEIAKNKVGIIKENTMVFSSHQTEEAFEVIVQKCNSLSVPMVFLDRNKYEIIEANEYGSQWTWGNAKEKLYLNNKIAGRYQVENAALAITVLETLKNNEMISLTERSIVDGISHMSWPGRLEVMGKKPLIVMDGSHNPQGVRNLIENISVFSYEKLWLIMGVLEDKDVFNMVKDIAGISDYVITTSVPINRSLDAEKLSVHFTKIGHSVEVINNPKMAFDYAMENAGEKDLVLVAGSLYLISELRKYYLDSSK